MDHKDKIYELKQTVKMWKRTCKKYEQNRKTEKLKYEHDRIQMRNLSLLEKVGKLQREVVKLNEEIQDVDRNHKTDKKDLLKLQASNIDKKQYRNKIDSNETQKLTNEKTTVNKNTSRNKKSKK